MSTAKPEFIDWPWLKIELSEAKGAHSSSENLMRYCAPGEPGGFGIEKWLIAQFNGPEVEAGLSAPAMHLVLQLVVRLLVVVVLCLGAATIWATIDAYRSVDRATAASAERVSQALEALYWRELLLRSNRTREHLVPVSEWRTIETMKLISPGICIRFEPRGEFENPLCGQSKGIGKAPPLWFAAAVQTFIGNHAAVARSVSTRNVTAGTVSAVADPDAAISLAWQHIVDNIHVALLMALAIAFFASLAIAHTLAPAQQIVAALQRMAHGQYRTSLPRFRSMELAMHSEAALVKAAFTAGASGYVTKSSEPAALIKAIRAVARGEHAMSDDIAHVLAMESLSPHASVLDQLGEREIEILRQLAAGATAEQIASNLNLSIKTVQNYHYLIKTKTGMRTDAQLVRLAVECGLASL